MVFVRIKPGYQMDGRGMFLGSHEGTDYYFWRGKGKMDVPFELAMKLHFERPQRVEIIDERVIKDFFNDISSVKVVDDDNKLNFSKLDNVSGFGEETMKDVKSICYLAKNVNSDAEFKDYVLGGGHLPLRNDLVTHFRRWLLEELSK